MSDYTFNEIPADIDIHKTAGDSFNMNLSYGAAITGHTFEAAFTSVTDGSVVQAITCTVLDAGAGTVLLSLTPAQTEGLAGLPLKWYMARTISGVERTELSGNAQWDRR